jgi:hypothetical protein
MRTRRWRKFLQARFIKRKVLNCQISSGTAIPKMNVAMMDASD